MFGPERNAIYDFIHDSGTIKQHRRFKRLHKTEKMKRHSFLTKHKTDSKAIKITLNRLEDLISWVDWDLMIRRWFLMIMLWADIVTVIVTESGIEEMSSNSDLVCCVHLRTNTHLLSTPVMG